MVKEIAYAELGKFKEEYPDYDILFASVCGSHLFGWYGPNSDIDVRGFYVAPTHEFFGTKQPPMTIEMKCENGVELQLHEVSKFLGLLIQPNMNFVECVTVPDYLVVETSPYVETVQAMAEDALSKDCYPHIQGLVTHMKKHSNKYNLADPKKNLYIIRALLQGIELIGTGKLKSNVVNMAWGTEYMDIVENLLRHKNTGEMLHIDERAECAKLIADLELRLLSAREYGIAPVRGKDDLPKRVDTLVRQIRRDYYYPNL